MSNATTMITVSPGNDKIGLIPSVSVIPGPGCYDHSSCLGKCYARRMCEGFRGKTITESWTRNFHAFYFEPEKAETFLLSWFQRHNPPRFRIHIGGDFFSASYLALWLRIIEAAPQTVFLAYTKAHPLFYNVGIPDNFQVIFSYFPSNYKPSSLFRHAIAGPAEAYPGIPHHVCPGQCGPCYACWDSCGPNITRFPFH